MIGHALLFTDLVDSTAVVELLGDARAASVLAEHDRARARPAGRATGPRDRPQRRLLPAVRRRARGRAFALGLPRRRSRRSACRRAPACTSARSPCARTRRRSRARRQAARGRRHREAARRAGHGARARRPDPADRRGARRARRRPAGAAAIARALSAEGDRRAGRDLRARACAARAFAPPDDAEKAYRVVRVGRLLAAGARGAPQPAARARRLRRPRRRPGAPSRPGSTPARGSLTVLGPGGTGKTRLVRRYGWSWLGDWPGGVYFCDLSEARTLDGVLLRRRARARRAARQGRPRRPARPRDRDARPLPRHPRQLRAGRRARRGHGRPLARPRGRRRASSSRAASGFASPARTCCRSSRSRSTATASSCSPLRARAQRPDSRSRRRTARVVQRIVRLLDGLPLAIELAAARIRVLSPAQLVERMTRPLRPARRRAQRRRSPGDAAGAIDWSWDLLPPWEQAALAQCSVFEGGFTLDAAEAVLDLVVVARAPPTMDVVQALVDKSLLRAWVPVEQRATTLEEPYFGMYLSIHEYAAEKLATSGADRQRAAQERHGRHFAALRLRRTPARPLYRHGGGARRRAWTLELDNLVAACQRAVAHGDGGPRSPPCARPGRPSRHRAPSIWRSTSAAGRRPAESAALRAAR